MCPPRPDNIRLYRCSVFLGDGFQDAVQHKLFAWIKMFAAIARSRKAIAAIRTTALITTAFPLHPVWSAEIIPILPPRLGVLAA